MKRVAIIPHLGKETAISVAYRCTELLAELGIEVIGTTDVASRLETERITSVQCLEPGSVDVAVIIGGDGAMLTAARSLAPLKIPLLGINTGHLGFMTQVEVVDVDRAMMRLASNEYTVSERCMVKASIVREGAIEYTISALNDVVLTKGSLARIVSLTTFVSDEYVATYRADGIIIATPTGSTAYSLSAGGPIVDPVLDALIITPICPHMVGARPIVVSSQGEVRIEVDAHHDELMLTADGQVGYELQPGDTVLVRISEHRTQLLDVMDRGFFKLVNKRISEGRL